MIIKWIKEKIDKILGKDVKRLVEGKGEELQYIESNSVDVFQKFTNTLPNEKRNLSKDEKVRQILKVAGCRTEIFKRIKNFENIDIENFRKTLNILTLLNFTKYELNVVLSQNIELLYLDSSIVNNSIEFLNEFLDDKKITKSIIYNNPFVINENIKDTIEYVSEELEKFGFVKDEQIYLLEENSNILSIDKIKLKESLKLIQEYYITKEKAKEKLLYDPIIIGINNLKLLESFD